MMQPDINDPAWIAERETLWSGIENWWENEGTRKMMKVLRRVFFEGKFDLQDKDCAWFIKNEPPLLDFVYYPVQTKDFWGQYFGEQCRSRHDVAPPDKKGLYNPLIGMQRYLSFEEDLSMYGWDMWTELELHEFFHGKEYSPAPLRIIGYESSKNYLSNPDRVVHPWSRKIFAWLVCGANDHAGGPNEKNKWIHLMSFFLSCLPYLDDKFFGGDVVIEFESDKGRIGRIQRLVHQVYHFNEEVRFKAMLKKGASEELAGNMVSRRVDFLKELRSGLESLNKPSLHSLLERAKNPEFKPEFSDKKYLEYVNTLNFIE